VEKKYYMKLLYTMNMYFVYVLLCADTSLYTGITTNPQRRFKQHQVGKGGAYTRSHKPVKILYVENSHSRSSALIREAIIKSWSREEKIKNLRLSI